MMAEKEPRGVRLGEALGYLAISHSEGLKGEQKKSYLKKVAEGVRALKYKARRKGEPLSEEHRRALDGLDLTKLNVDNPEEVVVLYDEIMQLLYSAQRAREVQRGLLEVLSKPERARHQES